MLHWEDHLSARTKRNKATGPRTWGSGMWCGSPGRLLWNQTLPWPWLITLVIHTTEFLLSVGPVMHESANIHRAVLILVSLPWGWAGCPIEWLSCDEAPVLPGLSWLSGCSVNRLFFWGIRELEIAHMDHTHAGASPAALPSWRPPSLWFDSNQALPVGACYLGAVQIQWWKLARV